MCTYQIEKSFQIHLYSFGFSVIDSNNFKCKYKYVSLQVPSSTVIAPDSSHAIVISDCNILLYKTNKSEPLICEAKSVIILKHMTKGALDREIQAILRKDSTPKTLRDYTDPFQSPLEDILLSPVLRCDESLSPDTPKEHYSPPATQVPPNRCPIGKKDPSVDWPKVILIPVFIK